MLNDCILLGINNFKEEHTYKTLCVFFFNINLVSLGTLFYSNNRIKQIIFVAKMLNNKNKQRSIICIYVEYI